ncbi:MAG: tetratricopeptide repeat protein [bacterium]|nr:tetratricopeptide repeat protein [bacterium]
MAQLVGRIEDGYYTSAIEYGQRLMQLEDVSAENRGEVHRHLARAHYWRAERERNTDEEQAGIVRQEYSTAQHFGAAPTGEDLVRIGDTHVWEGKYGAAVARYREAIAGSPPPALEIRRKVIDLEMVQLGRAPADLLPEVEAYVDDARDYPEDLFWGATTCVELYAAEGLHAEAMAFLDRRVPDSPLDGWPDRHEYLVCLTLYRLGQEDEAETRLRALRNRLSAWDELYARTGWLLGRVVLSDGAPERPAEALSFFREVIDSSPEGVYGPASQLGMAEALAGLERFDESLEYYAQVSERAEEFPESRLLSADTVRLSATVVAEALRVQGRLEAPLRYYEAATLLVDPRDEERLSEYLQILGDLRAALAQSCRRRANAVPEDEAEAEVLRSELLDDARDYFVSAGETFQRLARVNALNEDRSAEASWRAADLFDEAGETRRSIAVLEQFSAERPEHALMPRVLLRLGQARQALGDYAGAVSAYRENLRRYPRTPDAGSGLIPLARSYVALGGPEYEQLAEKTLVDHILDDSPVFTPEAPEFRDALFLLGELCSAQERFERSIAVLEEALERYPDDERALRAKSLVANAYRRGALALKEDISKTEKASEWPRMRAEMGLRLERAAELFAELVELYEHKDQPALNSLDQLVLQQSRLYQADCLFELGRYREAVGLYETAAFIYRTDPVALSAYVQVINCRLSLGQLGEARAALRRAQYLLKIMPDAMFEGGHVGQTRREWERFLNWLEQAKLLGGSPATA